MKIYLMLLFTMLNHWANGQINTQQLFELNEQITKNHHENYQIAIQQFDKLPLDSMDNRSKAVFYQLQSSYHSLIGNYDSSRFYWDEQYVPWIKERKIECDTAFYKRHHFVDAKDFILKRAKNEKVVMINEAHNIPYHRAFVSQLLNGFRQMGFKYLAIEDLSDQNINTTRSVTDTMGYYSREPLFAEMIREALRQNFTLVKYEAWGTSSNRMRDSLQAVNLAKLLKTDPQAKLLVYAGYDHIHEGSRTDWKKMAQFFKDLTSIDPLTISQTRHIEQYHPEFETGEFRAVNQFVAFTEPLVALTADSIWHDDFVDISLLYPRYLKSGQRPPYLLLDELRKAIPLHPTPQEKGLFVQAYYADEKQGHRIPADQLFIKRTKEWLYLKPGTYVLEFKNTSDQVVKSEKITVGQ